MTVSKREAKMAREEVLEMRKMLALRCGDIASWQ
jgi:hypothetical protein